MPANGSYDEPATMRGHHPDLTKTVTGCHVWRGSRYGPCWKHGTVGCCLIMHASPGTQRAYEKPRCPNCGRFVRSDSVTECSAHQ